MADKELQKAKLEAALRYQAMGLSVVPCGPNKRPIIKWAKLQKGRLKKEAILKAWKKWPDANPGIVTGAVSGIVVFDIDAKHGRSEKEFELPVTACSKTGNGGRHFFFKHPGIPVKTDTHISGNGVDMRGDKGYAVLPPSVNDLGGEYEWLVDLEDELAEMPDWLKKLVCTNGKKSKKVDAIQDVPEGARNDTAASIAGGIFKSTKKQFWEKQGWPRFKDWNLQHCKPPLEEEELLTIWNSIKSYHEKGDGKDDKDKSYADLMIELVKSNPTTSLFHDEKDEPYIRFLNNGHYEYWPCRSKQVKRWLAKEFFTQFEKAPGSDVLNTALNVLEGEAVYAGERKELFNRIALVDDNIFYSLSDEEWRVVKISKDGWEILDTPPALFKSYTHQESQRVGDERIDVWKIFDFINVTKDDHKLLMLVWLISCFIPDFPHPLVYIHGPQGSAKSTTSKILRRLIDPSLIEVAELPKRTEELIQQLSHHWFLCFDNIAHIPKDVSDILCRAVTGAGFSKRELYSDDSDIIYTFKRCLGLNGITLPRLKPDLLERSILIDLERLNTDQRRLEKEVLSGFLEIQPGLIASIFDIISKSLKLREDIHETDLPRMADFALWGCAISVALGRSKEEFLKAYRENISIQHDEVINDNLEALFVIELLEKEGGSWSGSPTELYTLFNEKYSDYKQTYLPGSASALSRRLGELRTTFREVGIIFDTFKYPDRSIVLRKVGKNAANVATDDDIELDDETLDAFNRF